MGSPLNYEIVLINNMVIILGKVVIEKVIDHNNQVRWFVSLNATYVHYEIVSILYKLDIYDGFMEQYG
jgi:hypothetical protein